MADWKYSRKGLQGVMLPVLILTITIGLSLLVQPNQANAYAKAKKVVLNIGNWEEYIDQGDWGPEETITLDNEKITSKNGIIEDFEDWYYRTYGIHVKVEYSTYGTNEDLYSKLILGEAYDLVCPSEYMFSRLMKEKRLQPLSSDFFKVAEKNNFYAKGVSPYIKEIFSRNQIDGRSWGAYAAGYMWGTMGIVYNPQKVSEQDASTWAILKNPKYAKRITIKDSVREAYFPTMAILNEKLLLSKSFKNRPNYWKNLASVMNDTSPETILAAESLLQKIRQNVYSFETDSGKADMVTGKIFANVQWSGDAAYAMDQAEQDGLYLNYSAPEECTNLWMDGWVMLKAGIRGDFEKQRAAEAFINFISRPDNAIRNMSYIGYTSVISGGRSPLIYDYVKLRYEAKGKKDTVSYPLGYFFSPNGNNGDATYTLTAAREQTKRQLFAQYPPKEVIDRSAIMGYFPDGISAKLNQMWINVRCFTFDQVPDSDWVKALVISSGIIVFILLWIFRFQIFKKPVRNGYVRVK